jgi:hypothetical protein
MCSAVIVLCFVLDVFLTWHPLTVDDPIVIDDDPIIIEDDETNEIEVIVVDDDDEIEVIVVDDDSEAEEDMPVVAPQRRAPALQLLQPEANANSRNDLP